MSRAGTQRRTRAACRRSSLHCRCEGAFSSTFPYVCAEPVLVKRSSLAQNGTTIPPPPPPPPPPFSPCPQQAEIVRFTKDSYQDKPGLPPQECPAVPNGNICLERKKNTQLRQLSISVAGGLCARQARLRRCEPVLFRPFRFRFMKHDQLPRQARDGRSKQRR